MFISREAQKAWNLIDQGRLDRGAENLRNALDRGNEDCMLHYAHGRVLHEFDCHAEARRHVQTAASAVRIFQSRTANRQSNSWLASTACSSTVWRRPG